MKRFGGASSYQRDGPFAMIVSAQRLHLPISKGALQLSAYRMDFDIGDGELFEMADEPPEPDSVEIGLFTGLCNTHETEGLRWKKWWLARDRTLIFATYNGPLCSADAEIQVTEGLLKTLEVRP
jgi:hypothetical protein